MSSRLCQVSKQLKKIIALLDITSHNCRLKKPIWPNTCQFLWVSFNRKNPIKGIILGHIFVIVLYNYVANKKNSYQDVLLQQTLA